MPVAAAIDKCRFFPSQLKNLLHIGEITGELDQNLDFYIKQKDLEVSQKIKKISLYSYIIILFILLAMILSMTYIYQ